MKSNVYVSPYEVIVFVVTECFYVDLALEHYYLKKDFIYLILLDFRVLEISQHSSLNITFAQNIKSGKLFDFAWLSKSPNSLYINILPLILQIMNEFLLIFF